MEPEPTGPAADHFAVMRILKCEPGLSERLGDLSLAQRALFISLLELIAERCEAEDDSSGSARENSPA